MTALHKLLHSNPIFQSLSESQQDEFARLARAREILKGEFLCHYGDDWPYLFLIGHGQIEAIKESVEGRSLLVATFHSNEIFWGLAFFDEQLLMPVTLVARKISRIYLWHRDACLPYLLQHGNLSLELSRLMVRRMLRASDMVEELAFQPVTARLARLLLEQYPADQQSVERYLTLDEMAARIGTTREMVCRILYRFAAQGAIQINRTEFVFKDRKLLEEHT
jgi:CRP/FNR family transcriptional regulator